MMQVLLCQAVRGGGLTPWPGVVHFEYNSPVLSGLGSLDGCLFLCAGLGGVI